MKAFGAIWNHWVGRQANSACLFAIPFLAGAGGSSSSFLFFGCFVWNATGLLLGKLKLPTERIILWVAALLFAYAGLRTMSVFLSAQPLYRIDSAAKPLAFLAFLPIVSALAQAPVTNAMKLFQRGASAGAIVGAIEAFIQIYVLAMDRAEGLSGNPGPFSTIMILSVGISATLAASSQKWDRLLGMAGMFAGLLATLLAGSKGMLPALLAVTALSAIYLVRTGSIRLHPRIFAASALALVLALLLSWPVINWRLVQLSDDLSNIEKGHMIRSIGSRLVMWEEGLSAFREKPLFGHGYNLRAEAAREAVEKRTGSPPGSHLHNGFVTDLTGNGLAGLVTHLGVLFAPFLLLRGAVDAPATRLARHFCVLVVTTYVITDMANLTFGHDILDSWYIFFLALLAGMRINSQDWRSTVSRSAS